MVNMIKQKSPNAKTRLFLKHKKVGTTYSIKLIIPPKDNTCKIPLEYPVSSALTRLLSMCAISAFALLNPYPTQKWSNQVDIPTKISSVLIAVELVQLALSLNLD